MNKSQLIDTLAARFEGNRKAAAHALDSVLDTITREVAKGEKVAITGFGSFERKVRESRLVRNPRTGASVQSQRKAVPSFKPGAQLRDVVSGVKQLPALTLTTVEKATPKVAADAARAAASVVTGKKPKSSATAAGSSATSSPADTSTATTSTAKKSPAKKSPAKKSPAKKSTAKKSRATKSTASKSTASKSAAKTATAKKSTATKSTAKKSSANKSTASKSTAESSSAKKSAAKKSAAKKSTAKKSGAKQAASADS